MIRKADFDIQQSTRKNKKYMAKYKYDTEAKWIHFGDTRYQQYKDSTPLKLYAYLDHNDKKRRASYKKRHQKDRLNEGTAGWLADKFLW